MHSSFEVKLAKNKTTTSRSKPFTRTISTSRKTPPRRLQHKTRHKPIHHTSIIQTTPPYIIPNVNNILSPYHIPNRSYSTETEESDLDDDLYGSSSSTTPVTGPTIVLSSSPTQQATASTTLNHPQVQQQLEQHQNTNQEMTIYNVISGVSPTPVGVTVFRLSGPHCYHILSLLSRIPLSKIRKLSQGRVFTSTLYSIPDTIPSQLLRDNTSGTTPRSPSQLQQPNSPKQRHITTPPPIWNYSDDIFASSISPSPNPLTQLTSHSPLLPLPNNDDIIDLEAMILTFKGPKSFTGEDTIELHVHGNPIIVRQLYSNLNKLSCAQVAKNGEFIQRAYLNNRLSLLQVEAYYDLLHSSTQTEIVHASKTSKMNRDIMFVYNRWRHVLVESLAYLESIIDFGEDEGDIDHQDILRYIYPQVVAIRDDIHHLLQRKTREKVVNGINVSIFGEPNVGKSSLLNKVIGRQLAIVSAIPGTTRDVVSTSIEIDGLPVQIHDTAGIRDTTDVVEWEGIRRATALSQDVDYKVVLFDATNLSKEIALILKKHGVDTTDKIPTALSNPTHLEQHHHQQQQQQGINDDGASMSALDTEIGNLISTSLTTQHPSIKKLISPQTLLVWTKCDLLPFTKFESLQTMSSQPTADPIYLQKQTKIRDEFDAQQKNKINSEIELLRDIIGQQQYNTNPANTKSIVDGLELFHDLAEQISNQRTLSLSNNNDHKSNTSPSHQVLHSIPLDKYITALTKRVISSPQQTTLHKDNSPNFTSSTVHDVLCVSSRYNYQVSSISTAIHQFAHSTTQTALDSASTSTLNNNTSHNNGMAELALTSLFAKHDITLSSRHRQSLLSCFDSLSAFLDQMETVCKSHDDGQRTTSPDSELSTKIVLPQTKRSLPTLDNDLVLGAASLRSAVNHIAEIDGQGEVHAEEVLDAVFNRFCIGK